MSIQAVEKQSQLDLASCNVHLDLSILLRSCCSEESLKSLQCAAHQIAPEVDDSAVDHLGVNGVCVLPQCITVLRTHAVSAHLRHLPQKERK